MNQPMPWHASQWLRLLAMERQGRLPHALLLVGLEGVGVREFARAFIEYRLCEDRQDTDAACGRCRACRLLDAGNHPDFCTLEPEQEKGKAVLAVEQVRALLARVQLTAHYRRGRVALIQPADRMNASAANALLKTLEEPGEGMLFVLLSAHPDILPATIRSRCQILGLPAPAPAQALEWLTARGIERSRALALLQVSAGAPLGALERAEAFAACSIESIAEDVAALYEGRREPLTVARRWTAAGMEQVMDAVRAAVMSRIRASLSELERTACADPGQMDRARLHCRHWFEVLDECMRLQRLRAARSLSPGERESVLQRLALASAGTS